jgi:transposase
VVAPDWIRSHVPVEWVERYGQRLEEERLPKEEQERTQYVNQVGADGWMLLDALQAPCTPDWMKVLPAVTTLHTVWEQPFEAREQGGQWRKEPALKASQLIASRLGPRRKKWQEAKHSLDRIPACILPKRVMRMLPN